MTRLVCVGGAHVDVTARARDPVAWGSSAPVTTQRTLGGVAGNVARVAARLGAEVAFVGVTGDDAAGEEARAALRAEGVDTAGLAALPGHATPSYTALLDPAGDLVVALADMDLYEQLTPDGIAGVRDVLKAGDILFLDANLPEATLRFVAHHMVDRMEDSRVLAFDAVSVAKAPRLCSLSECLLFANLHEARAAWGAHDDIVEHGLGNAASVVVTLGGAGLALHDSNGAVHEMRAATACQRDVTGAGDALIGAVLAELALGRPPRAWEHAPGGRVPANHYTDIRPALLFGAAAAAVVVEHAGSLPDALTRAAVEARLIGADGPRWLSNPYPMPEDEDGVPLYGYVRHFRDELGYEGP